MMKSIQIVERSRRLLYLYTANVTESRHAIFFLTLVYEELLETSLSLHFLTKTDIIITLIESKCKTIHQIMYKTKDKERKKRMKA